MTSSILIVEDDHNVRQTVASILTEEGYDVVSVCTTDSARAHVREKIFDAILLDLQLPDGDGLHLIRCIRDVSDAPILIISGRTETADKITGFETGADDYIAKPINLQEMTARINAQIRRYQSLCQRSSMNGRNQPHRIGFEDYVLDRMQMQVFDKQGRDLGLTTREYRLIEALVLSPKQVHTREQLLNRVRSDNLDVTDRAVDVQLLRIRRKLNDNHPGENQVIKAIRGVGYMLNCVPVALD